jgi:RNA polymerase sigma-70 factor (ECF subfamily)
VTQNVSDDRELYERFVNGDLGAFEVLFARYQHEIFGWVHRIVRDRSEAEELTVEALWRIYVARARFDPSRSFAPWARRIATNLALNRLRTLRRQEPLLFEPRAPRTVDPVERRELRAAIGAALAGLSPKLRLVATLALVEGLPYAEIADSLGLSREAVKSRVFRAVRKLRRALEAKGIRP